MAYFEHYKYTGFSGVNVKDGVVRFGVQLSAAMDSDQSNTVAIYTRGATPSLYFWNGTTETAIGAAGTGGVTTWDSLYDLDKSLTIDSTTLTFAGTHTTGDVITITNATGSGDCLQITNSGTGKDINGTSSTWSATKAGVIDCTGITIGDDETITFGDNSDITIQYDENGDDDLQITGNTSIDTGTFTIDGAGGSTYFTITAGDMVMSDGSLSITDADDAALITGVTSGTSATALNFTLGTTTGVGLQLTVDALTTGNALDIDQGGNTLTSGYYINCNDDDTAVFTVGDDGATSITGILNSSIGLKIVGVQTSEDTVEITSSGVTASGYGVLLINSSGNSASGSGQIRIAPSGTPVEGSTGIQFVGSTKLMQGMSIDGDSVDNSVVLLNGGGNLADNKAVLEVTADGTGVAGSSLAYIHSTSAGGATVYGLEINCDASNLEGLWVNAGATVLDESLTVGTTLGVTGASTLTGAVTCTAGVQSSAVQATATADGSGDGTITDGTSIVNIAGAVDATSIVILPTPTPGNVVWLITDSTGCELRSSNSTTIAINGGTAADAESELTASTLTRCTCTSATTWICSIFTSSAVESALEVAA